MDIVLNKLKEFKKIIYFSVCGLFAFLLLCKFISNIDNGAGAFVVLTDLFQSLFFCAILAAGLYGILKGKEFFCRVAFALLLGMGLTSLIVGVLDGFEFFEYFDLIRASQIIYYVFYFITGLFGTAFAVLVVLGWMLGRDDLKKYGGYLGVCYVGMSVLMIVFTIVLVADKRVNADWFDIVEAIYQVLLRAFYVVLATTGIVSFEETAASVAEKKKAAKPAEAPAEEPAEAPAE